MITKSIVSSFAPTALLLSHEETNNDVISIFEVEYFELSADCLIASARMVHSRDAFEIEVFYEHTVVPSRYASISDSLDFLKSIHDNSQEIEGDEKVTVKARIYKNERDGRKSIYSIEDIIKYWSKGTPYEALEKLQRLADSCIELESSEVLEPVHTGLFQFLPIGFCCDKRSEQSHRLQVLQRRQVYVNFTHGHEIRMVPEDFELSNDFSEELNNFFRPLKVLMSLIHLADNSKVDGSFCIDVKLVGYKSFSKRVSCFSDLNKGCGDEVYNIYSWVYSESRIADKIGLARNLMSIHVSNGDIANIQSGCLAALHSNYQIYLKDNLKQYIDIKNKIVDSIQKSSEKAREGLKYRPYGRRL